MIQINWLTQVIIIPRADMPLVQETPTEIRLLDLNQFRQNLKTLEASPNGMAYPDIHLHVGPVSVGGVSLARVVVLINGYSVLFEDAQYSVNLAGANTNLGDVVNPNQVSIRTNNSTGLVEVNLQDVLDLLTADEVITPTTATKYKAGTEEILVRKRITNGNLIKSIEVRDE